MAFHNRVKVSTATVGAGPLTLGAALEGFKSFAGVADGEVVPYLIENGTAWEVGSGTYTVAGGLLTRTMIESSTGALLELVGPSLVAIAPSVADWSAKANLSGAAFTGDVAVPGEAYAATWDGNLTVPTKDALFDKIENLTFADPHVPVDGTMNIEGGLSITEGIKVTGTTISRFENTGVLLPADVEGVGLELIGRSGGTAPTVLGYNRTLGTYGPLRLDASVISVRPAGADVGVFSSTGLTVTGTINATGDVSANNGIIRFKVAGVQQAFIRGVSGSLTFSADDVYVKDGANSAQRARFSGAGLDVTGRVTASGVITATGEASGRGVKAYSTDGTSGYVSLSADSASGYVRAQKILSGTGYVNSDLMLQGLSVKCQADGTTVANFTSTGLAVTGAFSASSTINGLIFRTSGANGLGIGANALGSATGSNNVAIGTSAGASLTSAVSNVLIGILSGNKLTTGGQIVAVGLSALQNEVNGAANTAIGYQAGLNQVGAINNSFVGNSAGADLTTGSHNTFFGYHAGRGITTGGSNTLIGAHLTNLPNALTSTVILAAANGAHYYRHDTNGARIMHGALIGTAPDLISNGTFATDTVWAKGAGVTISGGVASVDGTQAAGADLISQSIASVAKNHETQFTITVTQGAVRVFFGGGQTAAYTVPGVYSLTTAIGGATVVGFRDDSANAVRFIGTIDTVSVKQISNSGQLNVIGTVEATGAITSPVGFNFAAGGTNYGLYYDGGTGTEIRARNTIKTVLNGGVVISSITASGLSVTGTIKPGSYTVATLPVAIAGHTAFVTDGTRPNHPVYADGAAWRYYSDDVIAS